MPERKEKSSTNGSKALVKKEGGSASKSNGGVVKKEVDSHGHRKKDASSSGGKALVKSVTTVTKVTSVRTEEKKGKKVFTLPGQKHEAPEERDSLRIFYESLHEQKPESEMAEFWMMEHGLLDAGHAKKTLERKQRRQQNEKNGTPLKSAAQSKEVSRVLIKSTLSNGKSSKVVESKGKRKRDSSDDDDFISPKPVKRKIKT